MIENEFKPSLSMSQDSQEPEIDFISPEVSIEDDNETAKKAGQQKYLFAQRQLVQQWRDGQLPLERAHQLMSQLEALSQHEQGRELAELEEIEFVSEGKGIDYILSIIHEHPTIPSSHILRGLAGLDSDEAWALRHLLQTRQSNESNQRQLEYAYATSLVGVSSERAWRIREKWLSEMVDPNTTPTSQRDLLALSLGGTDEPRTRSMYQEVVSNTRSPHLSSHIDALIGNTSAWTWPERQQHIEQVSIDNTVKGLAGLDMPEAWTLRNTEGVSASIRIGSIACLESERAWEIRDEIINRWTTGIRSWVLKSLAGCNSTRAWEMRNTLAEEAEPETILTSITGLDSAEAWQVRETARKNLTLRSATALVQSVFGISTNNPRVLRRHLYQLPSLSQEETL